MKCFGPGCKYPSNSNGSVNFIDVNGIFVGYELDQDCCEEFGWFFSDGIVTDTVFKYPKDHPLSNDGGLEDFSFDKNYCQEYKHEDMSGDQRNIIIFRASNKDKEFKYLHLFNLHNGYYSHGFEVKHGEWIVKRGDL